MKPRILIVEDNLDDYFHARDLLDEIGEEDRKLHGIEEFVFLPPDGPARTVAQAVALLEEAADRKEPYDVIILDLDIVEDRTLAAGDDKPTHRGLNLLRLARRIGAAREIIIYTGHTEYDLVLAALRGGAVDFVEKGADDARELPTRVLGCWQRILARDSAALLEDRIKDLVPYAETGLAHRFTACFSDLVQGVAHNTEDIEHYARERFGIDREKDSQDYLIRCLGKQKSELKAARDNWAALKADLSPGDERPKTETLESLLRSIRERLSPCLTVKQVSFEGDFSAGGETRVLSFQDDVRAVLQEVVAGALSALPDYGEKHTIEVAIWARDGQAEVRFRDDLAEHPIRGDEAQAINGGFGLAPDHGTSRFGRAWGLSVVQHIALRGGGRLIVEPQPASEPAPGNQITYFVPSAR